MAQKSGITYDAAPSPVVRIAEVSATGVQKYRPTADAQSAADVVAFVDSYGKKELKPFFRSLPAPDPIPNGRLFEVVADTWGEVQAKDKDLFVNCFAPWCGHCQHLKPTWQELQRTTKYVPSLHVLFFDATQNDIPAGITVQGFPTMLFFPAKKADKTEREVVPYRGQRSVKEFIAFMKQHATYPIDENWRPEKVEETSEDDDISALDL
jgi:thiol-disulfide isomerase/thioredoxin